MAEQACTLSLLCTIPTWTVLRLLPALAPVQNYGPHNTPPWLFSPGNVVPTINPKSLSDLRVNSKAPHHNGPPGPQPLTFGDFLLYCRWTVLVLCYLLVYSAQPPWDSWPRFRDTDPGKDKGGTEAHSSHCYANANFVPIFRTNLDLALVTERL